MYSSTLFALTCLRILMIVAIVVIVSPLIFFSLVNIFKYVVGRLVVVYEYLHDTPIFYIVSTSTTVVVMVAIWLLTKKVTEYRIKNSYPVISLDYMGEDSNVSICEEGDIEQVLKEASYFSLSIALFSVLPLFYFITSPVIFSFGVVLLMFFFFFCLWRILVKFKARKIRRTYYPDTQILIDLVMSGANYSWVEEYDDQYRRIPEGSPDFEICTYFRERSLSPGNTICPVEFDGIALCLRENYQSSAELMERIAEHSKTESMERIG